MIFGQCERKIDLVQILYTLTGSTSILRAKEWHKH